MLVVNACCDKSATILVQLLFNRCGARCCSYPELGVFSGGNFCNGDYSVINICSPLQSEQDFIYANYNNDVSLVDYNFLL